MSVCILHSRSAFLFIPQIISPTHKKHPQYCKLSVTTQQNKGPNKHLRLNPNLLMLFNIKIFAAHNASEHRTSFTLQQAIHPSMPDVNGRQLCMDRITLYISMKWSLYYVTRYAICRIHIDRQTKQPVNLTLRAFWLGIPGLCS